MNNQPLRDKPSKTSLHSLNNFFSLFCLFIAPLIFVTGTSAQTTKWLYVITFPDGAKSYLRDEIRTLPNRNKSAWEKIVKSNGSSFVSLAEWDCPNRRRLTGQTTFYSSDDMITETHKPPSPRWEQIIPDSMSERH